MKNTHWYLRGWEYEQQTQPDGKVRQVLIYHGEYYWTAGGTAPGYLRWIYLASAVLLWAVLIILLTHISRGASLFFVGGACALTLIPAIYLAIGCIQVLRVPVIMTLRDMRSSYYRIRLASKWILALMLICLAGELFYLIFRLAGGYAIDWAGELIWLTGGIIGVVAPFADLRLLRRWPVEICPPSIKPE